METTQDKTKEIIIELESWDSECADGCCYNYGTNIYVNGVKLEMDGEDKCNAIQAVLNHLGYNAKVNYR